jgi:hypothetical protein
MDTRCWDANGTMSRPLQSVTHVMLRRNSIPGECSSVFGSCVVDQRSVRSEQATTTQLHRAWPATSNHGRCVFSHGYSPLHSDCHLAAILRNGYRPHRRELHQQIRTQLAERVSGPTSSSLREDPRPGSGLKAHVLLCGALPSMPFTITYSEPPRPPSSLSEEFSFVKDRGLKTRRPLAMDSVGSGKPPWMQALCLR